MSQSSLYKRAIDALTARLADMSDTPLEQGRTVRLEDNLVPGLSTAQIDQIRHQLGSGDGDELKAGADNVPPRAHAAHSSAALAANAFGRWFGSEQQLSLCGLNGFDEIALEAKQPIFTSGTPPNLDCLARGGKGIVGIESKLTEFLRDPEQPSWSGAYSRESCLALLDGGWRETLDEAIDGRFQTERLRVDQLLKHVLGLAKQNPHTNLHLVYVYWEPTNADDFDEFVDHREEIAEFAGRVQGASPNFHALSYHHLLRDWQSQANPPPWLAEHVSHMLDRYGIPIA